MSSPVDWIAAHMPKHAGRYVMPYLVFAITVLLFLTVIDANRTAGQAEDFALDLRKGLVTVCERSNNPLRVAVQGMLRDQIRQSQVSRIAQFFPQIPRAQLASLLHAQNAERRQTIRQIAPPNCERLYPAR